MGEDASPAGDWGVSPLLLDAHDPMNDDLVWSKEWASRGRVDLDDAIDRCFHRATIITSHLLQGEIELSHAGGGLPRPRQSNGLLRAASVR